VDVREPKKIVGNGETGIMSPFDRVIDRTGTESMKWVYPRKVLGVADAIPMWVADMDFEAPPAVVEALRRRAEHGVFGYPLVPPSLYEAAIGWLERRHGWTVEKKAMAMTPGIVPALNYCVRAFTRPGDPIIIQTPVYHPFYYAIENNGRRVVRNPLRFDGRRYVMDLDDLRTRIDAPGRMLILCSPHNPVGRVWDRDELEALGRIAVERDLVIIADEIHHDLVYQGHRHHVLAALAPELAQQTVTCIAPSKTFNTAGLATAAVVAANPDLHKKFEEEAERSGFDLGNALGIVAFEAAYAHGDDWLDALLPYLEGNVDLMEAFLAVRLPKIKLIRPEGTYLALLDCRALGLAPDALNDFFLKRAGVYFSDGAMFGKELEGFVRVNFGCPRSVLREALERIERAIRSQ
jgi:cystathionine beta-lyase